MHDERNLSSGQMDRDRPDSAPEVQVLSCERCVRGNREVDLHAGVHGLLCHELLLLPDDLKRRNWFIQLLVPMTRREKHSCIRESSVWSGITRSWWDQARPPTLSPPFCMPRAPASWPTERPWCQSSTCECGLPFLLRRGPSSRWNRGRAAIEGRKKPSSLYQLAPNRGSSRLLSSRLFFILV